MLCLLIWKICTAGRLLYKAVLRSFLSFFFLTSTALSTWLLNKGLHSHNLGQGKFSNNLAWELGGQWDTSFWQIFHLVYDWFTVSHYASFVWLAEEAFSSVVNIACLVFKAYLHHLWTDFHKWGVYGLGSSTPITHEELRDPLRCASHFRSRAVAIFDTWRCHIEVAT